jgi:hypothetical protein
MMTQRADEVRRLNRAATEVEEPLPITVVPDWDEQVRKACQTARLIDRHLDYEEKGRRMLPNERLTPIGLCPEQRVNMVTDLVAATRA